jgi:hypothetical protein
MDYVNNGVSQQDEEVDEDKEQVKFHGETPPDGRCKYRSCNDIRFLVFSVSSNFYSTSRVFSSQRPQVLHI